MSPDMLSLTILINHSPTTWPTNLYYIQFTFTLLIGPKWPFWSETTYYKDDLASRCLKIKGLKALHYFSHLSILFIFNPFRERWSMNVHITKLISTEQKVKAKTKNFLSSPAPPTARNIWKTEPDQQSTLEYSLYVCTKLRGLHSKLWILVPTYRWKTAGAQEWNPLSIICLQDLKSATVTVKINLAMDSTIMMLASAGTVGSTEVPLASAVQGKEPETSLDIDSIKWKQNIHRTQHTTKVSDAVLKCAGKESEIEVSIKHKAESTREVVRSGSMGLWSSTASRAQPKM